MRSWSLSIISLLCTLSLAGCKSPQQVRAIAMDNAKVTASATGGNVIDCSGIDSDGDGYVSCSVKSSTDAIIEIECSDISGAGCKIKQQKYSRSTY
jgi:hypothetical protein